MSPGVDSTAARGRAGWISVDPRWLGELAGRELGPLIAGWVLPFVLIVYLALKGGGYSSVVHGQVGVAAWWFVLLGALIGVLPAARVRPVAWLALGLASAFAVWTALGIGWSESAGRSVAELGRVAAYFGVFALALAVQGRDGLRRMVGAVAAAIAVVGLVALLSRLHPEWFPPDDTVRVLRLKDRLSYPLNYWNGLAALMAIGLPLALALAAGARTLITRALAGAAVPLLALTTLYTLSRGGIAAAAIGVVAVIALSPRRLAMMPTLLAVGGGTAILLAGALQRGELSDGARTAIAHAQGDEMLAMTLVVCAGVALIQVAIALADRHGLGPRPSVSRPATAAMLAGAAVVALAVGLAAGVPGEISDRWEVFKQPGTPGGGIERLESAQGSFRYQAWGSALDANATDPLTGIGPGTFEFWWAQEREVDTFIRDAHSLYLEMLGELGIVGLVLIVGMIGTVLIAGSRGAFSGDHDARAMCAAATAGCISFAVAAAVDWAWELAVLPIVFFLLSGAILGPVRAASAPPPALWKVGADQPPFLSRCAQP